MAGGVLGCAGLLVSGFAPNLPMLIFGYGVLIGTANSMVFNCSVAMMNKYFHYHRSLANGISGSSSGLGAVMLPFLYQHLTEEFSVRGALIITAGFWLNLCAAGALLRPLSPKEEEKYRGEKYEQPSANSQQVNTGAVEKFHQPKSLSASLRYKPTENSVIQPQLYCSKMPFTSLKGRQKVFSVEENFLYVTKIYVTDEGISGISEPVERSKPFCSVKPNMTLYQNGSATHVNDHQIFSVNGSTKVKNDMENTNEQISPRATVKTFCSISFILYAAFIFSGFFGFYGVTQFIPPYCKELNMSKTQASTILSIVGALDIISRLVLGVLGDMSWVNKKLLLMCNFLIAGSATIILPFIQSWYVMIAYAAIMGLFGGCFLVYVGPLVVEAVGVKYVGTGGGLTSMLFGIANGLVPITFGALKQWTGTYHYAMVAAGCFYILGALFITISNRHWFHNRCSKKLDK